MKKLIATALTLLMALSSVSLCASAADKATETIGYTYSAGNGTTYTREMEALDRGLIAVKTDDGVFLSWRLLDSEDNVFGSAESNVSFDIYRDGTKIHTESATTNYVDPAGTVSSTYSVVRSEDNPETRVIDIGTDSITVYSNEVGAKVYAAKYNDKLLDKAASFTITSLGENTFATDFTADKVFIWDSMKPIEGSISGAVKPLSNNYFDIPLVKPANEVIDEGGTMATKSFSPTDCSAGDLDGDGEYEIVVKWVSQECDVGNGGYSGTVRLAAYKLDGTRLWDNDINLGKNVYSSAHTVQFLVYDFDGNGKAEMMCQTSLGSKDAAGDYVSHSAKPDAIVVSTGDKIAEFSDEENAEADFDGYDRKVSGEEFLTVFNGETGEAVDTIDLPTTRGAGNGIQYGDDFGNRSNRFVADVAYLDGEKPYAVYLRGYYFGKNGRQRTSIAGISFDGERLSPDYRFDTQKNQPGYYDGAELYVGQGNHNCTVADVDNDGKDEFITGALCMEVKDDNTFKPRWCTFLEHGDALHIGDYDPTHNGLEFFTVHEDGNGIGDKDTEEVKQQKIAGPDGIIGTDDDYGYIQSNAKKAGKDVICNFGMSVIDADTGDIIFHKGNTKDTGRGVMANTGSGGFYQITGVGSYQCNGGNNFTSTRNGAGSNFRIFWDGDLYDNLLDGTNVTDWNGRGMSSIFNASSYGCVQINGTKANPALQADLFGDWREELVYPTKDGTKLRVFTTTTPTEYKVKTLMHDPVYRSGVAAEQTAYNQPPHVGFYMDEEMFAGELTNITVTSRPDKTTYDFGEELDLTGLVVNAVFDGGTEKEVSAYSVSGYDKYKSGSQTITVSYKNKSTAFDIYIRNMEELEITNPPSKTVYNVGDDLDLSGLVLTAKYDNGETKILSDGEYSIAGFDKYAAGEQVISIAYGTDIAKLTVNIASGFILDDEGYVTSYSGSSDSVICPSSVDGITLKGFRANSMSSSGVKKMYFYHEPIDCEYIVFPLDMTIACYENSTMHEYATTIGMKVELIEADRLYADIDADDEQYSEFQDGQPIVYQHAKQEWSAELPYAVFGVGARSNDDGGDNFTGIYKRYEENGNAYLEAKAGQFSTVNRHAYIRFADIDDIKASNQYKLSFDFCILANSSDMSIVVANSRDFAVLNNKYDISTNSSTIYALQANKDGVLADTAYHYELLSDGNALSQTITNINTGQVITPDTNAALSDIAGAICFPSTGTSRNQSVSAYIDNIKLVSDASSNLRIKVTDSDGTSLENAEVELQGASDTLSAAADENGSVYFEKIPSGAYTVKVTYDNLNPITQRILVLEAYENKTIAFNQKVEILASVSVNVTDADGLPVADAQVTLREIRASSGGGDEDENIEPAYSSYTQTVMTDSNGIAEFQAPIGRYRLSVAHSDFNNYSQNVRINKDTASFNVQMSNF